MRLGQEISVMQIGARQLAARSAKNKGKKTTVIKGKSIPTMTPFIAEVWARFAESASSAYGGTMEDVNRAVARGVAGLDTGASLYKEEVRRIRHEQITPANIRKFREEAAKRGRTLGLEARPPAYERYVPERY